MTYIINHYHTLLQSLQSVRFPGGEVVLPSSVGPVEVSMLSLDSWVGTFVWGSQVEGGTGVELTAGLMQEVVAIAGGGNVLMSCLGPEHQLRIMKLSQEFTLWFPWTLLKKHSHICTVHIITYFYN